MAPWSTISGCKQRNCVALIQYVRYLPEMPVRVRGCGWTLRGGEIFANFMPM